MVFQLRFHTILALFFISLIINANGSFDDPLHRLDVKQRSLWDIHNVDMETMKGAALYCQSPFCVSWDDTNGFALSFSSNRTARHMFVDPIALSPEDRYRRCWKGQCAHFEARMYSLFITYGYVDKQNPRNKQSISQTSTPSVIARRLVDDLEDPPSAEEPLLPKGKPGETSKKSSALVRTLSRARATIGRSRSKSKARKPLKPEGARVPKTGPSFTSRLSSMAKRKPKKTPSAMEFEGEPSDRILSRKAAKDLINSEWIDAQAAFGKEAIKAVLAEWKSGVFDTAISVFAREHGKFVQGAADVVIGALTGPHEAAKGWSKINDDKLNIQCDGQYARRREIKFIDKILSWTF